MKRFLLIFLILPTMLHAEWFGPKDTLDAAGYAPNDLCIVQKWRCLHNATADSMGILVQEHYADDTTWGLIYANSGGEPGALVAKTSEYFTGASGAAWVYLQFSDENLSENTDYFIGVEHRSGSASNSRIERHRDTLRQKLWYYVSDTAKSTWPTGSDATDNSSSMTYERVYYTTTVAYDTTARDTSVNLANDATITDNPFSPFTTYGTTDSLWAGTNDAVPIAAKCRPIMAHAEATANALETILLSTSDIIVSCSTKVKFWAARNVTAADSFYVYFLKCDSSGTSIHIDESRVDADTIRSDAPNRALWTTNGAGSAGNDYYNLKIDSFGVGDTNSTGWYVRGGDTSNYNGWMRAADSINYGSWHWRGVIIYAKSTLSAGDLLILYSSEGANPPVFSYKSLALSQQAAEGGATTDRHGETNRHGAYRH